MSHVLVFFTDTVMPSLSDTRCKKAIVISRESFLCRKLLGLTKIGHDLDKAISNVSLTICNVQKPCTAPNTRRNEIHSSCNLSDVTSGQNKLAICK